MTPPLILDASVAVKWIVPEEHAALALSLKDRHTFAAPEIIYSESSNTLWKKVRRGELRSDEARTAIDLLTETDILPLSTRTLARDALKLSVALDHPAYDCFYLCAAAMLETVLVTADQHLLRRLNASAHPEWARLAMDLVQAQAIAAPT